MPRTSLLSRPNGLAVLGWRVGTWDLPDVPSADSSEPGATIYAALRAVHRARDPLVVERTLRECFIGEMNRLHSLGTEDLVEVRRSVQNIMCLAQVRKWKQEIYASDISAKEIVLNDPKWREFVRTNNDFEYVTTEKKVRINLTF